MHARSDIKQSEQVSYEGDKNKETSKRYNELRFTFSYEHAKLGWESCAVHAISWKGLTQLVEFRNKHAHFDGSRWTQAKAGLKPEEMFLQD